VWWTGSGCGFVVAVGCCDLWWLWVCGGCRSPAWDVVVGRGLLLAVICGGCRFVVAGGGGLPAWDVVVGYGLLLTVIGDSGESMEKKNNEK
jgi:hypothetical protein